MRILVISDSHGRTARVRDVLERHREANYLLFLGDGVRDVEKCIDEFPTVTCMMVRGNCDSAFLTDIPLLREETLGGKHILMTHGHMQQVKFGEEKVLNTAGAVGADILLYGHTHRSTARYIDGLHVLNPGSLGYDGTYGIVDITPYGVLTNIASL